MTALAAPELDGDAVVEGRYRLLARISNGSATEFWQAHDEKLGRTVALRVFRPGIVDTDRQQPAIEILARLSHPGLVSVFDAGTYADAAGSRPYLAVEFVGGASLRERLAGGPLPVSLVAAVGTDLAGTLAFLHAQGLAYGEVRTATILLPDAPRDGGVDIAAKLADLGTAQLSGTPAADVSKDIDALGRVLIECLSGATAAVPGHAHLPENWRALLTAMTSVQPTARPSATVVARRLAEITRERAPLPPSRPEARTDAGYADVTLSEQSFLDTIFDSADDDRPAAGGSPRHRARRRAFPFAAVVAGAVRTRSRARATSVPTVR